MLWFNNVLPALLPFIVIINLLTSMGVVRTISAWASPIMKYVFKLPGAGGFAFITGIISGYPMGAKAIGDLWRSKEITTKEAQRLLTFCNNAGPLFIVGVVGVGLLGNQTAGYALWMGHVAAAIIMGLMTRGRGEQSRRNDSLRVIMHDMPNIGKVLGDAVKNAMDALVVVGGLIIFFAVVTRAVVMLVGDIPYIGVLAGMIEITGGVKMLSEGVVTPVSLGLIGGVIAFGGFSVHAQALHFTAGTGVKAGQYVLYKLANGIIAGAITWLLWSAT
ncbi:MAG: hypothetical protein FWC73_03810 [Defluviitaleaceae bacterium]|nr:hypothetical protein [Defluviitaleaceae bacterium]